MDSDRALSEVFLEACRRKKPISFVLNGSSMYPVLRDKDVVIVQPIDSADAAIGNILAFQNNISRKIVVHRLIRKEPSGGRCVLQTAADAGSASSFDPPISEPDYAVAKVVGIVRDQRKIDMTTAGAVISGRIRVFLLIHCRMIIHVQRRIIQGVEKLSSGRT
jgi:signal peptidase I